MPEGNKVSKSQQKAVNKYVKNNYDRINVTFPKGRKTEIKAHADAHGESVNAFIVRAVNETMERDGGNITPMPEPKAARSAPVREEKTSTAPTSGDSSRKKARAYAPLTPENIAKVDLQRLLPGADVRYQVQIAGTFGLDGLQKLSEMALKQNSENSKPDEEPETPEPEPETEKPIPPELQKIIDSTDFSRILSDLEYNRQLSNQYGSEVQAYLMGIARERKKGQQDETTAHTEDSL